MSVSVAVAGEAPVELPEATFGLEFNEALVHQAVVAYLAGGRQGSKAQKTRAEVRGGGRKPWRQKRTGRARAGSIRSPLWRGGGRTFAARPADHSVKLNRKMYRGAVRCIFSELIRQHRLIAIPASALSLETHKTKAFAAKLQELKALLDTPPPATAAILIVAAQLTPNLQLAARNLPHVEVRHVDAVDPVTLMGCAAAFVTVDALRRIEERLA